MTLLLSSLAGFALAFIWDYFCTHVIKKASLIILGWRLHHSLYGVLLLIVGYLVQNMTLLGIGIGVLVQHTLTDGFRFISKEQI